MLLGAPLWAAQTAVSPGSPSVSDILSTIYTNGETWTRVEDYPNGGNPADEGAVNTLSGAGGLFGKTDQSWQGGLISATAKARFAGFNHSFGWERGGTNTILFPVTGSGYAVTGGVTNVDLSGGAFRFTDSTGFNVWSSKTGNNDDDLDHMVAYFITGGNTVGPTWLVFFDDENGGGDRDFNDMVIEVVASIPNQSCNVAEVDLTNGPQGSFCGLSLRPVTSGGSPAPFVLTARSHITSSQPTNPDATGQAAAVATHNQGIGVRGAACTSENPAISGSVSIRDEEMIFTFDTPVLASSIRLGINQIHFNSDDPVIFISSSSSAGFDYTILEEEIEKAFTFTNSQDGHALFAEFTSLPSGLYLDVFKLRETRSNIFIDEFELLNGCSDGNPCTADQCVNNVCTFTPANSGSSCSDGVFCNGLETCQNGSCVDSADPCVDLAHCDESQDECVECLSDDDCNDNNICTKEKCDGGQCYYSNNNVPCSDGNECTINDCCGNGVCVPGAPRTCNDNNACTNNSCNPATGCVYTPNSNSCNDGNKCTTTDTCSNGMCVGGPPPNCNDGNVCTTDSCSPSKGCKNLNNTMSCNDGNACTTGDACSGGACVGGPAVNCGDGNVCTTDSCNPATGCVHTNNGNSCNDGNKCTGGDVCSGGSCGGTPVNCNDNNACTVDSCSPGSGCSHSAVTCNDNNPCTTDSCNPATGCVYTNNTLPCNDKNVCTTVDVCSGGTCTGTTPLNCSDNNVCTTDSCHPVNGCQYANNTGPCNDSNACTTNDTCGGGTCHGGPPPNCDDNNVCTNDACNPNTGCVYVNNMASCNDNNACTTNDMCSGGSCVGGPAPNCDDGNECTNDSCNPVGGCAHTNKPAGTACGNPANTNCDNPDTCNSSGMCQGNNEPNGTSCSDGLVCNGNEVCVAGVCTPGTPFTPCCKTNAECNDNNVCNGIETCVGNTCQLGTPLNCNDGNPCTNDSCHPTLGCQFVNNTNPCSDGNACTTNDTCGGGSCNGGPAPNCDDGNVCTTDSCHPVNGCTHVNNTDPCSDGNACTTNDTCGGGTCNGGPAPNCDDGNVCTDDSCNPVLGCVHANNTNSCSDNNACTTNDTCSAGMCVGGPPPNCNDGNVCTTDACDPLSGCTNTRNSNSCDDGNACTTNDTCGGGTCHGGPAPNCDDGNVCTDDSCHPVTGCGHVNNTAPCDDDDACTTNDTCGGGTCNGGPPQNCDDGNPCTTDSCDSVLGCLHVDNTDPCNDGNACTTNDTCGGGTCNGGPPPVCNDGNVCTTDSCHPMTGCVYANNTNPCSDGNACTLNDVCSGGMCVGGPAPNCDDMNVCTDDACHPLVGCVNIDNTDPCNDGNACTTNDTCSSGSCIGGPPPNCDDGNVCTNDSCHPINGCQHMNNTAPCSDGNACTTNDTCALGVCVGGTPPNCDDMNVCTIDSCVPTSGCAYADVPDGTHCGSTGTECVNQDVCIAGSCFDNGFPPFGTPCGGPPSGECDNQNTCDGAGSCMDNGFKPAGTACGDASNTVCDNPDTCDGFGGCVSNHEPNGTSCADGLFCNGNELCVDGACTPGVPITPCCKTNAECSDNNVCNGVETCVSNTCVLGTPLNCDDGNQCTDDSCHPVNGCQHVNNTDPCSDGNACTTNDTCGGGTCNGGPPPVCNDNNVCTDDSCDPMVGCVYNDNTAPCTDGNACTTNDTCLNGACLGGPAPDCDDGNVCTTDACHPATGCTNANNTDPCDDGNACTTNDTCGGGQCNGGPPPVCDDNNVCTDDACNPLVGCVVMNNTDPCTDGNACTTGDVCTGGICTGGAPPNCDDFNVCTDDVCHPLFGCQNTNNTDPCSDGNACTTADACVNGSCVGGPPPNCDDNNFCTDDSCDMVLGCINLNNSLPCNDGNECTTGDVCTGGICTGGAPPNCDDLNVCTDDGCDPFNGCFHVNNSDPCTDGNACTTNDACVNGACVGGPPPNCNDMNVCTDDACDMVLGCVYMDNNDPCTDGNACTTNDACMGGMCVGGPAPDCDDMNECTFDSCHPASGCVNADAPPGTGCGDPSSGVCDSPDTCDGMGNCDPNHEPNGTSCSDGLFCNGPEICIAGVCTPGLAPPPPCCETDADCNDNDVCDGMETCVSNMCMPGTPLDCDDMNACTTDACDPLGGCFSTNNSDPCSDGNACTVGDVCSGGMCVSGGPANCDDMNPCTTDSCDPMSGCQNVNNTNSCDDGNACTTGDVCVAGQCVGGPPPNCDDGNLCTDDSCDPQTGCASVNNSDPCSDGNLCTVNDVCMGGMCVGGGPLNCDDGNVCTDDSCNPGSGCVNLPNNDPCTDGNACTTNDVCSGGMCVGGPPPNCDDGSVCTTDACDPSSGCEHVNNMDSCTDGNACTTNDTCVNGACVGGPPPVCNDGNVCTTDSCDPIAGCVAVDNSIPCTDGNACTVNDTCSNGMCVGTVPLSCGDNNPCTTDTCVPAVGCVFDNNSNPCDDGSICTTGDQCVNGQCTGGPAMSCNDGNLCTDDNCHPTLGCQHANNTRPCEDGQFCTTGDQCIGGMCLGGGSACPGQVCDENANACLDCLDDGDCDDNDACTQDQCVAQACANAALSCTTSADCPGNSRCINGACECDLTLCLEAEDGPLSVDDCYSVGDEIVVNIIVNNSQTPIVGGQFYFGYNPADLKFVSIAPGATVDPTSPFEVEILRNINEEAGTIFYAVSVALGSLGQNGQGGGTTGPAVLATIVFIPLHECEVDGVCFLPDDNPLHTYLVDVNGDKVTPTDFTCCTGDFNVNGSPPDVNCPDDIITNADCDSPTAVVNFPTITAFDNCDGSLPFVPACSATYWSSGQVGVGPSLDLGGLVLPNGGEFPPGITVINCTATNSCGVSTKCEFTVTVTPDTTLEVIIQLSPTIVPGPIERCIEFELYSNCVESPLVDSVLLDFGIPFNFPGHSRTVTAKIPAGQYACITARDPLHTLRSVAAIDCIGTDYFAEFKGDPTFGGNWLIGGNLDGSRIIDILDFGVFISQYLKSLDPDTVCGFGGAHADINGDGIVDSIDYAFIANNYLAEDKELCCDEGGGASNDQAVTEITVPQLIAAGLGDLAAGDLNGDGVLNAADMALFGQTGGLVNPPALVPVVQPPAVGGVDARRESTQVGTR